MKTNIDDKFLAVRKLLLLQLLVLLKTIVVLHYKKLHIKLVYCQLQFLDHSCFINRSVRNSF